MRNLSLRALLPAAALILGATAYAWANCAPNVSSSEGDLPMSGWLVGTETRTETVTTTILVTGSAGVGSGTIKRTVTTTRTYEVGTYDFGDGVRIQIDCSTYTPV